MNTSVKHLLAFIIICFYTLQLWGQSAHLNSSEMEALRSEMIQLFNEARAKGCICGDEYYPPAAPVVHDPLLSELSHAHNVDMAKNEFRGHQGSDGRRPGQRVNEATNQYAGSGEILAYGTDTPQRSLEIWLNSPGHCAIIMNADFSHVGVDRIDRSLYSEHGRFRYYWTAKFGVIKNETITREQAKLNAQKTFSGLEIVVYSRPSEPLFATLREELEITGINYDFRDIENPDYQAEVRALRYYANRRTPASYPIVRVGNRLVERVGHLDDLENKLENEAHTVFTDEFNIFNDQKITVYGRPRCNRTLFLTRSFDLAGYKYQFLDINADSRNRDEMWRLVQNQGAGTSSGNRLQVHFPVVQVGNRLAVGASTLEALLEAL
ncbi:MAG: CAP domain-containing protein [Cyclobacteriaceae bacterium]|nr:hypothetical protein [Cyclobacteriaceae bacterium]MCH8515485.1 CAP domain-containing protein [Cyclobacteriaceae bacterium]